MIQETIDVIKHGTILKQYPCDTYALSTMAGMVTVLNKGNKKIVSILSPNFYDYIEVNENELDA